jgi:hypothetical protein
VPFTMIMSAYKLGYRDGQKGEPYNERNKEYERAVGSLGVEYKKGFEDGAASMVRRKKT